MELKKTIYGVVVALILGLVIVWPATEIVNLVYQLFSIKISYTFLEFSYVILLILICKFIFKKMDKKIKLEEQND